jgi:hypothetical protein
MKIFLFKVTLFIFAALTFSFSGCTTSYKDMPENEFWNENEGRYKIKTDSSYIYQVEMFNTDAEYKSIDVLDKPVITSNFTKIISVNNEAVADTSLFYTVRITQKKRGFERITEPVNNELYLKVNNGPMLLNIQYYNVQYVPPLYSAEYGYKNGYYYCDVMCRLEFDEFVRLANAVTIEGTLAVKTTIVQEPKSIEGEIKYTSKERSGDAQIINRFYNAKPVK